MFEQVVGNGANLFVIIIAVLALFVGGLSYIDYLKVKKEESGKH